MSPLLIVIRRDEERLYEYLAARLAGVAGVQVVLDRRRQPAIVDVERRQAERRLGRGESLVGLCTTVRFRRGPPARVTSDMPEPESPAHP